MAREHAPFRSKGSRDGSRGYGAGTVRGSHTFQRTRVHSPKMENTLRVVFTLSCNDWASPRMRSAMNCLDRACTGCALQMKTGYSPIGPSVHERMKSTDDREDADCTERITIHRLFDGVVEEVARSA